MDQIIEQLIKLNKKDCLDVIGILLPMVLTIVIIVQNRIYFRRTNELEKQIHNRDRINQYHNDVLAIYNTYYEFCDTVFASGFEYNVKSGNVNLAVSWTNNLFAMKMAIGRKMDLAKLIFRRSNRELYDIVEQTSQLAIKIIDKYLDYINSGRLLEVSENAWVRVVQNMAFKHNYTFLAQNPNLYNDFMKLCQSTELEEIQDLIKVYHEKHSYENYDKYFEEYFSLDGL